MNLNAQPRTEAQGSSCSYQGVHLSVLLPRVICLSDVRSVDEEVPSQSLYAIQLPVFLSHVTLSKWRSYHAITKYLRSRQVTCQKERKCSRPPLTLSRIHELSPGSDGVEEKNQFGASWSPVRDRFVERTF